MTASANGGIYSDLDGTEYAYPDINAVRIANLKRVPLTIGVDNLGFSRSIKTKYPEVEKKSQPVYSEPENQDHSVQKQLHAEGTEYSYAYSNAVRLTDLIKDPPLMGIGNLGYSRSIKIRKLEEPVAREANENAYRELGNRSQPVYRELESQDQPLYKERDAGGTESAHPDSNAVRTTSLRKSACIMGIDNLGYSRSIKIKTIEESVTREVTNENIYRELEKKSQPKQRELEKKNQPKYRELETQDQTDYKIIENDSTGFTAVPNTMYMGTIYPNYFTCIPETKEFEELVTNYYRELENEDQPIYRELENEDQRVYRELENVWIHKEVEEENVYTDLGCGLEDNIYHHLGVENGGLNTMESAQYQDLGCVTKSDFYQPLEAI